MSPSRTRGLSKALPVVFFATDVERTGVEEGERILPLGLWLLVGSGAAFLHARRGQPVCVCAIVTGVVPVWMVLGDAVWGRPVSSSFYYWLRCRWAFP